MCLLAIADVELPLKFVPVLGVERHVSGYTTLHVIQYRIVTEGFLIFPNRKIVGNQGQTHVVAQSIVHMTKYIIVQRQYMGMYKGSLPAMTM